MSAGRDPCAGAGAPRGDLAAALAALLRASAGQGAHAEAAHQVVLGLLLAQLLADAGHAGPPHEHRHAPRHMRQRRHRLPHRDSLCGRRPRG